MPNLIEVQKDSYKWFLDEGLKEAFADISPITDYSGKLSLDFVIIQNSKKAHENNNIHIIMNYETLEGYSLFVVGNRVT